MFWPFLAAAAIASAMIKLGALSVTVSVLSTVLKVVIAVAIGFSLLLLMGRSSKAQ